ncbi:MAG: hypothetical protein HQP61_05975 [Peptococcaceae bacterium]|nr:hypothetical protein [Candidatus Syntrophopropionicum ammoniitolerans]
MQETNRVLVESIKQEILSDPVFNEALGQGRYNNNRKANNQYGQIDLERIKKEVLTDLRGELPVNRGNETVSDTSPINPYDQTIADSVKKELLADMRAREALRQADLHGYGDIVSDQNIGRMIRQRHRTLQDIKRDLAKELDTIQAIENRAGVNIDPQIQDIARSIVTEARGQGVSINEVKQRLLGSNGTVGSGWFQRVLETLGLGQRKGFAYGIGAAILAAMLWPTVRQGLHSVAVQSMESGMGLADRARSVMDGFGNDFTTEFGGDGSEAVKGEHNSCQGESFQGNEPPVLEE